jgi:hypothetical protein
VNDLVLFRNQTETEIRASHLPIDQPTTVSPEVSWLDGLRLFWKPAYFAAAGAITVTLIVAIALLLSLHSGSRQKQGEISGDRKSPTPAPSVIASAPPNTNDVPPPTQEVLNSKSAQSNLPKRVRIKNSSPDHLLISLNDVGKNVSIYDSGRVSGLEDVQPELRQSIIAFLSQEEIKRPDILAEINGPKSALRGTGEDRSFKLSSPVGSVINDVHPTFKWESMQGASSYQVYVTNWKGRNIAKSEKLSANITEWVLDVSLNRGEVYSWSVVATVGGEEIVSPPVPEPEVTFKILESRKARELDELRRKTRSPLALGVFYAREGMIEEAGREFHRLHEMNRESPTVSKILRIIQSWR